VIVSETIVTTVHWVWTACTYW